MAAIFIELPDNLEVQIPIPITQNSNNHKPPPLLDKTKDKVKYERVNP